MGSSERRQAPAFFQKDERLVHSAVFKKNGHLDRMQKVGLQAITARDIKQLSRTKDLFEESVVLRVMEVK